MPNDGANRLARVLQRRMGDVSDAPPILDFGVVLPGLALKTNFFPEAIPQGEYMVCRSAAWGAEDDVFCHTQHPGMPGSGKHMHGANGEHPHGASGPHGGHASGDGSHMHPPKEGGHFHPGDGGEMEHVHDVLVGGKFRSLLPGDRVLVAWVGNDACVIDLILPAAAAG